MKPEEGDLRLGHKKPKQTVADEDHKQDLNCPVHCYLSNQSVCDFSKPQPYNIWVVIFINLILCVCFYLHQL